ncbi:dihydroflavonol 4-reductase isoform X1 [Euphorbia lathyris]|uniref:dihydroflavonol 4-reductase isoform X1 n=1 Tax=Euphorbia lathyris TaxID=212925 RepID=UPI0033135881
MVILFLYIIKLKEESCLFLFPQKKKKKKMEKYGNGEQVYCVTGANGYIGSCLVKLLLQNGYTVHATIRNPEKWSQLLSLWDGGKKLRVFKADLEEEGSFDEAVKGCHGVFHVAASMEFSTIDNPDFEYVESKIIEPAKKGTLNLMKSCSKYKVKKVVFTSSISTLTAKDTSGKWRKVVDETCQNPIAHVLNAKPKPSGWVYVVSKLVTEEAALDYGKQNGIDVVSVITTTVGGSFLTSSVPASIQVILSPLTGMATGTLPAGIRHYPTLMGLPVPCIKGYETDMRSKLLPVSDEGILSAHMKLNTKNEEPSTDGPSKNLQPSTRGVPEEAQGVEAPTSDKKFSNSTTRGASTHTRGAHSNFERESHQEVQHAGRALMTPGIDANPHDGQVQELNYAGHSPEDATRREPRPASSSPETRTRGA